LTPSMVRYSEMSSSKRVSMMLSALHARADFGS
jgi:hypothetical protein